MSNTRMRWTGAGTIIARFFSGRAAATGFGTVWACGLRELAAGLGVGSSSQPGSWLWARVAGDAVDLALLGTVLARHPARRTRTLAATAAVLSVTAADVMTARRASRDEPGTRPTS